MQFYLQWLEFLRIFSSLTADAFGVNTSNFKTRRKAQAMIILYQGYTAKVAGTRNLGIMSQIDFLSFWGGFFFFGAAFSTHLQSTAYATLVWRKDGKYFGNKLYGWLTRLDRAPFGTGLEWNLAIPGDDLLQPLKGNLEDVEFSSILYLVFQVRSLCPMFFTEIYLNPRATLPILRIMTKQRQKKLAISFVKEFWSVQILLLLKIPIGAPN